MTTMYETQIGHMLTFNGSIAQSRSEEDLASLGKKDQAEPTKDSCNNRRSTSALSHDDAMFCAPAQVASTSVPYNYYTGKTAMRRMADKSINKTKATVTELQRLRQDLEAQVVHLKSQLEMYQNQLSNVDLKTGIKQPSLSEYSRTSLAGLQDRIVQMQETHDSTTEELQATLAELTELQEMVDNLDNENAQLHQTVKILKANLSDSTHECKLAKIQVANLKHLVMTDKNYPEREEHLHRVLELTQMELHETHKKIADMLIDESKVISDEYRCDALKQLQNGYNALKCQIESERREWQEMQKDLLLCVRIADDYRFQAEGLLEHQKNLVSHYKSQVEKLEDAMTSNNNIHLSHSPLTSSLHSNIPDRMSMATLRNRFNSVDGINKTEQRSLVTPVAVNGILSKHPPRATSVTSPTTSTPILNDCKHSVLARVNILDSISTAKDNSPAVTSKVSSSSMPKAFNRQQSTLSGGKKSTTSSHDSLGNLSQIWPEAPFVTPMHSILRQTASQNETQKPSIPVSISSNELLTQIQRLLPKGTSRRNALLKWAQLKIHNVDSKIDVTNFSSSWNDGTALCALLAALRPDLIDYNKCHHLAEAGNEIKLIEIGLNIVTKIGVTEAIEKNQIFLERPDWHLILKLVTDIFNCTATEGDLAIFKQ